jgi:dienelactone hydrolase
VTDPAPPPTFETLETEVMERFGAADYEAALELLDRHADRFPANGSNTAYLRACIEARRGRESTAIGVLRRALDDGLWFSETILRQSPSLQPLQGAVAYEALVAAFAERPPTEAIAAEPLVDSPSHDARGLLVAFHGNGQAAPHAVEAWRPLIEAGWIVAAPHSSQMLHSAGAVWDEAATARADVRRQAPRIGELIGRELPTIVAGFSLGGDVALWSVLSGTVPARRLLLIGPAAFLPDDAAWPGLRSAIPGLQVRVLLGTADEAVSAAAVERLVEEFRAGGASVRFDRVPGLAHAYPPIALRREVVEALAES